MDYKILKSIKSPDDIKKLNEKELVILCSEIRSFLISTVSKSGGHLASNLGTVELTVALHRVFNSPEDAIFFDVGHQCYTHKLLTGRFDNFGSLRSEGGISPFMNPYESNHDPYVSGHSSNSISAAFGLYKAKVLSGQKGTAIAVIGDGALTGGMAYEALNNAGENKSNFIVVLNDNKMSISKNVGGLARHLTKIRTSAGYHSFKSRFSRFLNAIPLIGPFIRRSVFKIKTMFKNAIFHSNIFEGLGYNYLGPVDGHDLKTTEKILKIAKNQNRPALVHVVTVKGKGYEFAENDPGTYHGVSNFDIKDGFKTNCNSSFSYVFGKKLCKLAQKDEKICAITAAMTDGTGLNLFSQQFPDRFFDVGIAEEHAMTFAAGLAAGGMKPYIAIYSSFLQRAYDQIIHDIAIMNLPVRICIDRAGFVGEDGKTHQGLFDISLLTSIPNMTVYSPSCFIELEKILELSTNFDCPVAIRYPRGGEINNDLPYTGNDFDIFGTGRKTVIVSYGRLSYEVKEAINEINDISFIKLNKIFPIAEEIIDLLCNFEEVFVFEETVRSGSIGEKISVLLTEKGFKGKNVLKCVDNTFVDSADIKSQMKKFGLDSVSIIRTVRGN